MKTYSKEIFPSKTIDLFFDEWSLGGLEYFVSLLVPTLIIYNNGRCEARPSQITPIIRRIPARDTLEPNEEIAFQ